METIIVKENWKTPFVGPSLKKWLKQGFWFATFCCIVMGVFALIYCCFLSDWSFFEGLKWGAIWFVISLAGGPLIILSLLICIFPFLLLFSLPKMISPNTYEFGLDKGRFLMKKNNSVKVDISLSDYMGCAFVTVTVNKMGGNDLGNSLKIEFLKNGKKTAKEINLAYISDEDIIQLRHFMMLVGSQNEA